MKKTEPTKNTVPSAAEPTSCTNPGNGPTKKQSDPIANRIPIHHAGVPRPRELDGWSAIYLAPVSLVLILIARTAPVAPACSVTPIANRMTPGMRRMSEPIISRPSLPRR